MAVKNNPSNNVIDNPMVMVYIPPMMDDGIGLKMDQTEHVTINGVTTIVPRGRHVEVTVPVFVTLKEKYPDL